MMLLCVFISKNTAFVLCAHFFFLGTLKAPDAAEFHSWLPRTQAHQACYCLRPGAVSAALQEVRAR